ncbi:MAG: DUF1289 domain-containing protein [Novosphingobium sp.]|uniref:DUF1289 domain-containing protein n=1 Tax=Novosphingobium sp. TaxID=1874826 RepID=UPI00391D01E6|nr:DUF1289 domain-containing protein [Novosphingobium sp.]
MAPGQARGPADDAPVARTGDQALSLRPPPRGPDSPCDGTCRIDQATGWCLGCKRTLNEIADWPMLRPQDKHAILRQLKDRV